MRIDFGPPIPLLVSITIVEDSDGLEEPYTTYLIPVGPIGIYPLVLLSPFVI